MEQKTISKMLYDVTTDLSLRLGRFVTDQEELINVLICKGYKLDNIYVESEDTARPVALVIVYAKGDDKYTFRFNLDNFLTKFCGI